MSKSVNLAIIGTGVVGSAFVNQLKALQTKSKAITYNVILIAKAGKSIYQNGEPLDLSSWSQNLDASTQATLNNTQLLEFLKKDSKPTILIDNTSNAELAAFYPTFIENGISIATPNKKAFSSDLATWNKIWESSAAPKGGLVYHEATVGAGLPILGPLRDLIETGDKIEKIEGIFSGSLSYIFNLFSTVEANDLKFSDIVNKAKQLGYTEPDPRDDLNGMDFARKVTILARIAGFEVESPSSFEVQSLVPKELESLATGLEFLAKLPEFDAQMESLKNDAAKEGKVLRFVGLVDIPQNKVSVSIEKYDGSHPFASLKGSDNVISIKTERYTNPMVIQGAGAGADVTAAGVLADAIKIAQRIAI